MLLLLENFEEDKSLLSADCSFQFVIQMMERKIALFPTNGFSVWVVELSYDIPCLVVVY